MDAFEGGHRIPFILRWPGKVKAGTRSDETICLTDLLATCASIVGAELPNDAGEDSFTLLPALLGSHFEPPLREATVHHSGDGTFAIRKGKWKLELGPGSGGMSAPTNAVARAQHLPPVQLYNLEQDIAETINVFEEHRDVVNDLTVLLDKYKTDGRSAPIRYFVCDRDWSGFNLESGRTRELAFASLLARAAERASKLPHSTVRAARGYARPPSFE